METEKLSYLVKQTFKGLTKNTCTTLTSKEMKKTSTVRIEPRENQVFAVENKKFSL